MNSTYIAVNEWISPWIETFPHVQTNSDDKLLYLLQFLYVSTFAGHKVLGISEIS